MILSIIVPVYQVEKFLPQCLNSILKCDLSDCEVILSLGNSKDRSNLIAEEYEMKCKVVHTITQSNTGLSNARNCALREAKGNYVLFLDSDDYTISENLNYIIAQLRDGTFSADVIATDYYQLVCATDQIVEYFQIGKDTPIGYNKMESLPKIFRKGESCWTVWRYIYRRDFLEKNQIYFLENKLAEDMDFTTRVLLANPSMIFCHCPYYVYRVGRENSLSEGLTLGRFADSIIVAQNCIEYAKETNLPYRSLLLARLQREYVAYLSSLLRVDKKDRKTAICLCKDWKKVLKDSQSDIVKIIFASLSILGIPATAYLLYFVKSIRNFIRDNLFKRGAIK